MGFFFAAALAGCASAGGVITSLEDLSTDSSKEGLTEIPQYRVASIAGWLPFADVGGLYFYKPGRKPASAIGLSPGKSFEIINEIPGDQCNQNCLVGIRDQIIHFDTLAQILVQKKIALSLLEAKFEKNPSNTANDQNSINLARDKYNSAQNDFNTSYEGIIKSIINNGVLVYTWSSSSQQSANIQLDNIASVGSKKDQKNNGFALVSGIRTKQLFVGKDLLEVTNWMNLTKESRFKDNLEITTSLMQAKNILYGSMSNISVYADAKINASFEQLGNIAETFKNLTKIELGMTIAKVSNLSNIGVMGNMKRSEKIVKWDDESLKARLAADDWLTFYSVESDFADMVELLK